MQVLYAEAGSLLGAVGMILGSEGVVGVVGYTADSMNAAAVLGHGTVGWDLGEGTSNPFQLRYLDPVLYPCPFAPGGGSPAPGSPGVVEEEEVPGAPVG